jgi:branched-chain amino acid transport system substrate-binding protein
LALLASGIFVSILKFSFLNADLLINVAQAILFICGMVLLVRLKNFSRFYRLVCLFIALPLFTYLSLELLQDLEKILSDKGLLLYKNSDLTDKLISLSYYFIPSINLMIVYKYEFLDENKNNATSKIPEIISLLVQTVLFAIPTLIVLSRVFGFELTSILATSGVLAAIIGLAIQANLSNILSGVFVNIERPFSSNEWVSIGSVSGLVSDVTWRSTRLRTLDNTEITIPNELVASSIIVNWSRNDSELMSDGFNIFKELSFHPRHDPQHLTQLLHNALKKVKSVDGRKQLDLQLVNFIDVSEYGLKFEIGFDCTNPLQRKAQQNAVLQEVHKTLQHAGIGMSVGRLHTELDHDVGFHALKSHRTPEDFEPGFSGDFNPYNEAIKNEVLLQKVPIFASMNHEQIRSIAENCKRVHFKTEDLIIKQNDPGDSLFIIADGVVSIQVDQENGSRVVVSKLGVGDFFGEMSLMTGEPTTANVISESPTVALKVDKETIKALFLKNPKVFDLVSEILAKRKIALGDISASSAEESKKVKNIAKELKNAIISFLS